MKRKLKQYEIYKIETSRFTTKKGNKITVVPLTLSKREALERGELVKIQSNQLTNRIFNYFRSTSNEMPDMRDIIVNIVVPTEAKKSGEKEYAAIAKQGVVLNGQKYVRLYSGSGQIRRNTITFIREDLYETIFNSLLCGLTLEDFGKDFNAAKFNAYCGLNMSGCHLLPADLSPNVCIVDDYEAIRPHNNVNYVSEEEVKYITLPEGDYILTDSQNDFEVSGEKATRKSDGIEFTVYSGIKKHIVSVPYDEIANSPALNSFDGQGLMSVEWAQQVSDYLGWEEVPSEIIVRAPWVKGLLVTMSFKEWFEEQGITTITDSFGKQRNVSDIDCLISKSQFKMFKVYKAKCEKLGVNAWDYHTLSMKENNLRWGVVKGNKPDDDYKALNYQYIQALQLSNEDVEKLCLPMEEFLKKLNSGNIEEIYENLVINNKGFDDCENNEHDDYKALFQKVIEANPNFINDKYIRELIYRECSAKFNGAKIGKILTRGNFQFCVSDPIAQLEWIANNHCGKDIEIRGSIPAGCAYSNYWLNAEENSSEIVLMRSPLIDRNEIAKRKLIDPQNKYLKTIKSGIVYSIFDLTPLQQGGCDFDGDITYSTNDKIILKGCLDYENAKPLYYELKSTDLIGSITQLSVIEADIRGLNSAVGKISNKGVSLYAKLSNYPEDSIEYKNLYNSIVALGQVVGMEIDRIKTAVAPTFPLEWSAIQAKKCQNRDFEEIQTISDEEQAGIYRHNELVPNIKPYYFKYCYDYLAKSIAQLEKTFNTVSVRTFGCKLKDLIKMCELGTAEESMAHIYQQYQRAYPVIDSDCIVNHICHHFEQFEKDLKRQVNVDGHNMLKDFVKNNKIDETILKEIAFVVEGYQRYKKLVAQSSNMNLSENNKAKAKNANEVLSMMRKYYRDLLYEITSGDLQLAFDCIVTISKSNEKTVWELMDSDVIEIIK